MILTSNVFKFLVMEPAGFFFARKLRGYAFVKWIFKFIIMKETHNKLGFTVRQEEYISLSGRLKIFYILCPEVRRKMATY